MNALRQFPDAENRPFCVSKGFGFLLLLIANDLILREPESFILSLGVFGFDLDSVRFVLNVAFISGLMVFGALAVIRGANPSRRTLLSVQAASGAVAVACTAACARGGGALLSIEASVAVLLVAFAAYGVFASAGLLFWVLALGEMRTESAWFHIVSALFVSSFAYAFFLFAAEVLPACLLHGAVYAASFAMNCATSLSAGTVDGGSVRREGAMQDVGSANDAGATGDASTGNENLEGESESWERGLVAAVRQDYKAVLCITGLNFVLTASRTSLAGVDAGLINVLCASGIAIASTILYLLSFRSKRGLGIEPVYQVSFPVIALAFLVLPFLGVAARGLFMVFATAVGTAGSTALFLLAFRARSRSVPLAGAYGLYSGFMHIFLLAGLMLSLGDLQQASSATYAVIASLIVYLMFIVLFVSRRRSETRDFKATVVFFADRGSFHDACQGKAGEYGLSKREAEVMELLILGKGVDSIAQELCISANTVRTHTKNIYKKLKVHSRAELVELVSQ